jgi:hypothetical protein
MYVGGMSETAICESIPTWTGRTRSGNSESGGIDPVDQVTFRSAFINTYLNNT